MNDNLASFVLASMVVIVFMGNTATSNQLLRGGRAGRQLEKGNDDILIPPFTANNTTYADYTSVSGHIYTSSSSNDTIHSTLYTEEKCDDCYLADPKICWGYMHSSYCGYDTDDDSTYTDDGQTSSSNDTSNSTLYTEEQKCDDCYLDEGSSGGCTICYYPKICWGDMHSSYCGYDTDDYTDDGS